MLYVRVLHGAILIILLTYLLIGQKYCIRRDKTFVRRPKISLSLSLSRYRLSISKIIHKHETILIGMLYNVSHVYVD